MPTVYIDGQPVELDAADNLLEALLAKGVDLPYFCWHPALGSVGACRQCAVVQFRDENDDRGRIVMSCMTPVTEGALFSVQGEAARGFRESVVENLMINHPHDCPVCEEGGECHLQDMTVMVGHRDRQYRGKKKTFRNQNLGPFIGHEMNRCITCYRCVRFYQDYAGGQDLAAFASRDRVFFGREADGALENEFAGNLVEVCPTGVFTDKPFSRHYTRKWDLQSAPSICTGCALGCNIAASERYGELRRIHNRYNHRVNGYFLCDRGRFGGAFVNSEKRIPWVGIRNGDNVFEAVTPEAGLDHAAGPLRQAGRVIGIGSPRASVEANYLLGRLVGRESFHAGLDRSGHGIDKSILEVLTSTRANLPSLLETESYDAVLVLGEDVTNHAPRLALSLRQAVRHESLELADNARIPLWHDAAVRKIGQDDRSPLIVVTPGPDRLDDVARIRIRHRPDEIATLGYGIAAALAGGGSGPAAEIAELLTAARKPLIVSGSACGNEEIVKAAANVANALAGINDQAGLMLCPDECNSLGLAMLSDAGQDLDALLASGDIDSAIVLENDLSRRLSPEQFERLLSCIDNLIVIDHLDNATTSAANLVFPAATFAESEGTLINNEGTAQRFFEVFVPQNAILPSWHWLARLGQLLGREGFEQLTHIDDVTSACEQEFGQMKGIVAAAPDASFRIHGARIPRMTHRYSGRTAMRANISVHEPKQPVDSDSALAYTMEGSIVEQPAALRPYTWAPGWNSNQSINKFQAEIGGPLKGGDPGVRVLTRGNEPTNYTPASGETAELPLVPRHHIFGSDELSANAAAIAESTPRPYCLIHPTVAERLQVGTGDGLEIGGPGASEALEVIVDENTAADCVIYALLPGTAWLRHVHAPTVRKAQNWTPRESGSGNVISSDRDS